MYKFEHYEHRILSKEKKNPDLLGCYCFFMYSILYRSLKAKVVIPIPAQV